MTGVQGWFDSLGASTTDVKKLAGSLQLGGEFVDNTTAGTTAGIVVYLRDRQGYVLQAEGLDVPVDTTAGYAKGCLFVDTNVAGGTSGLYVNVGTTASANFDLVTDA
jgi:hypothetical protein